MFRSRSWFGTGWGRPKNPHSLEHLKYLYNVLSRNQTVSEHNRGLLVESLRCIAEILIWGDQNDSSVFDFFLEKNMLSFFLRIMRQRSGGSSFVCVQLLQTLNILFENIRNETSLYYLLSNNHVNSIIVHKFDFSDEEVMAYYISFLKTLSLKLNAHTIHFFYNEHTNDFPLYTEAIKFFNHPESMVRIAVRTLTLNVYKVEDASMLAFIRDRTAAPYFSNIVWFIGKHIHELDTCVRNDADHQSQNRLADLVAEHLDHLHYLNDILCLNIPDVNQVLTEHLLHKLLIPMYIYSLNSSTMHNQENSIETAAQNLAKILNRKVNLPEVASEKEPSNGKVSCIVALFLLSQVFLIISHAPLIETLSWIILRTNRMQFEKGVGKLLELYESEYQKRNLNTPSIQKDTGVSSSSTNAGSSRSSSPATAALINCESHLSNSTCTATTDSDSGDSTNVPTIGCNGSTSNDSNITDEQKQMQLTTDGSGSIEAGSISRTSGGNNEQHQNHADKPFFKIVLSALDCTENDYSALFALSLLYAMANNKGVRPDLIERILRPKKSVSRSSQPPTLTPSTSTTSSATVKDVKYTYNQHVVDQLLQIVMHACQPSCRVRLVTLELALRLLVQVVTCDGKNILTEVHRVCIENARAQSVALLRNFYKSEEIFLDMFEHEYCDMSKTSLNVEWLCMDSAILLPPTGTPLTGIDFTKRLPCGEVERARRAIRVFFLVRDTVLTLQSDVETQLPLTNPQSCVHIDQALDLNNSDLLACTVLWKDGTKMRRFLVIDVMQLILVEPDTKKLGWGVAKLVGFLQDIEVSGDKDDSRCLHITIQKPLGSSGVGTGSGGGGGSAGGGSRTPLLSARFMFDDNIRCMAAKQRLTKGRMKVRQKKMQHIARLLEIPGQSGPPSPAYMGAAVGVGNRNISISGRGIVYREARSLFGGSMAGGQAVGIGGIGGTGRLMALPGFAAPRRDSTPGILHRADAANMRRQRDSNSPSRIAMANAKGGAGSGGSTPVTTSGTSAVSCVGSGNGIGAKMRSRESSANRSKSRDTSPRMPRPRSEEIPLELIKKSSPENSIIIPDASSKMSIIPRPQTPVMVVETEPETVVLKPEQLHQTQQEEQEQQLEVASITSEETSFIGEMSPKKKGSIETV